MDQRGGDRPVTCLGGDRVHPAASAVERGGVAFHFRVEPEFEEIYRDVFVLGEYDVDFEHDRPCVVDCGAHIGVNVLRQKQRYPNARVVAFEPSPSTVELLRRNVAANALRDVDVVAAAVSADGRPSVAFHVSTDGWGMRDSVAPKRWHDGEKDEVIEVRSVSLRPYLRGPVDLLKMDIEGSETEVLRSVSAELANVANLVLEFHFDVANPANELEPLLAIMADAGLRDICFLQGGRPVAFEDVVRTPPRWVVVVRASRPGAHHRSR